MVNTWGGGGGVTGHCLTDESPRLSVSVFYPYVRTRSRAQQLPDDASELQRLMVEKEAELKVAKVQLRERTGKMAAEVREREAEVRERDERVARKDAEMQALNMALANANTELLRYKRACVRACVRACLRCERVFVAPLESHAALRPFPYTRPHRPADDSQRDGEAGAETLPQEEDAAVPQPPGDMARYF